MPVFQGRENPAQTKGRPGNQIKGKERGGGGGRGGGGDKRVLGDTRRRDRARGRRGVGGWV